MEQILRQCNIQGPGLWHERQWLLRWSRLNLRLLDRLVWNLAIIVSANKATSFTLPKIIIFGDVFLAFKCAPDKYYAKIQTLYINSSITHFTILCNKTQFNHITQKSDILLTFTQ